MFVSNEWVGSDFGGLNRADEQCALSASELGLEGTYVAWFASESQSIQMRLRDAEGWVNLDGLPVAQTVEQLLTGELWYAPTTYHLLVRTNVDSTGKPKKYEPLGSYDCAGWTSVSKNLSASSRFMSSTQSLAHELSTYSCEATLPFLCLGIDHKASPQVEESRGRHVFVSERQVTGDLGVEAFDDVCQQEAQDAGLRGHFIALVTTGGDDVGARLDVRGATWVRPDGRLVYKYACDARDRSTSLVPINLSAKGQPFVAEEYRGIKVWSGAGWGNGILNCEDWHSPTAMGRYGDATQNSDSAFYDSTQSCSERAHLYCFQNSE